MYAQPVDRKKGLEYIQREELSHLTPAAEAIGYTNQFALESSDGTTLGSADPYMMTKHLIKRAAMSMDAEHFSLDISAPGYTITRPRMLVNSICNVSDYSIDVILVRGDNYLGPRAYRATLASGTSVNPRAYFPTAFCVPYLVTTSGPVATGAQIGFAGTWAVGGTWGFTFYCPNPLDVSNTLPIIKNNTNGAYTTNDVSYYIKPPLKTTFVYTAVAGDVNNAGSANSAAVQFNASPLGQYYYAQASNGTITFAARQGGSLWSFYIGDLTSSGGPFINNQSVYGCVQNAGALGPMISIDGYSRGRGV